MNQKEREKEARRLIASLRLLDSLSLSEQKAVNHATEAAVDSLYADGYSGIDDVSTLEVRAALARLIQKQNEKRSAANG